MKRILVALAAILTLTLGLVAPAAAQGDQEIVATPSSVDAAGEHEITVEGSGYTGPAFLLPCPGAGGDLAAVAEDSCDLGSLTPVAPDSDGNFTATVTWDIPAEGLVMVVGNAAQTEVAAAVVSVGGGEAMADESMEDDAMEEASDDLAETGVESSVLVIAGGAILAAGALFINSRRELAKI